jgi:three-Cys-motif partner protein
MMRKRALASSDGWTRADTTTDNRSVPPKETIWAAEPHTVAKHRILRKYLGGWLPVISSWKKRVLFIDGFCGPGEYTGGEEGSPIIALRTLLDHAYFNRMSGTEFVFIFIDQHADRIDYLENVALPRLGELPSNVRIECAADRFDTAMTKILDGLEDAGHNLAPAFAFVDPFGFSDTPMDLIARILTHPQSEIFVTVMLENINRFLAHPDPKIAAHYDTLFGDPGWRDLVDEPDRLNALGNFYADQLRKHAEFVWSFRMQDEGNRPIYDLFFATKHIDGLKKMKRAMWSVDAGGGRRFSDRHAGGVTLFDEQFDTTALRKAMMGTFSGQDVSYEDLERWVLVESDFHDGHIKTRTLRPLEDDGLIACVVPQGRKRWGRSYPDDCLIRFY